MIDPSKLHLSQPKCIRQPGLWRRTGLWAFTEGVLDPVIYVDSGAEVQPGFEALMYHESLHAIERHALLGLVAVCTVVLWPFMRRAGEVRADVFALRAAGPQEFRAFVLMHPHPTGMFWRWVYGRTPKDRAERAFARVRREDS